MNRPLDNPTNIKPPSNIDEQVLAFNEQLNKARQEMYVDQCPMFLGEITGFYKDNRLKFKNLPNLSIDEKTSLIENLFFRETPLVITIEADENDLWHVVDGDIHTIATILELQGLLPDTEPLTLSAGKYLTILDGMTWDDLTSLTFPNRGLDMKRHMFLKRYPVEVLIFNKTY
jgi:hypothetical protein